MKTICFVLPKYAPENIGGAELQVYYLARALANINFQVHYIREQRHNALPAPVHENIVLHTIPRQKYFFMHFLNLPFIWMEMNTIKADYWYVRVSMWNLALVQFVASYTGGKVIWACSHDREVSTFKPRTSHPIKRIFERAEHTFFIKALKKTACKLVQTTKQQKLLQQVYALESTVLQNSHPVPALKKTARKAAVLWVANMRDFKRPHLFIELAKELAPYSISCIMVGAADNKALKTELLNVQQAYSNFQYLGALPVAEVYEQLQTCKLLINTSTEEGFPNTFIQAWLSGVPVLTLGVDPADIIKTHGLGTVTSSIEEMKQKTTELLNNEEEWLKYSERSRQYAVDHFDITSYVKKFITIINIEK